MGGCCAQTDPTPIIDSHLRETHTEDISTQKLLLLGSGSSGKSTIFKQLKDLYADDSKEFDVQEVAADVRRNCVLSMNKLLQKSAEFAEKGWLECALDVADAQRYSKMIHTLVKHKNTIWSDLQPDSSTISARKLRYLGECIEELWQLPALAEHTYAKRNLFCIGDSAPHFFKKSRLVFEPDYTPSFEDYLKVRIRTVGMKQLAYQYRTLRLNILDVGGQRNERRKWYQYFENVCCVLFVASLAAYYSVTFEDESQNALHESVEVFSSVVNHKAFQNSDFIVILNKNDLFRRNLHAGISLSECFSMQSQWKGPFWNGPNYDPNQANEELSTVNEDTDQKEDGDDGDDGDDDGNDTYNNSSMRAHRLTNTLKIHSNGRNHRDNDNTSAGAVLPATPTMTLSAANRSTDQLLNTASSPRWGTVDESERIDPNSNAGAADTDATAAAAAAHTSTTQTPAQHEAQNTESMVDTSAAAMQETIITDPYFEKCYTASVDFIKAVYLSQFVNRKCNVFFHITTATQRSVVKRVFYDVQRSIFKSNMKQTGLIIS